MSLSRPPSRALRDLFEVLRICPDYRRVYAARAASLLGDWFNLLAVLALLRSMGEDAAIVIGTVVILKLLPLSLAGPAAGVVADRFPRKTIMLVADGLRFFLVVSMFLAPLFPRTGVYLVYTLTFLQNSAQAFSEPARVAAIPNLVPDRLLGAANALGAATWSVMFTLGAAAGGLVTTFFGWPLALAVDAFSYLVSVAILLRASLPPTPRQPGRADLLTYLGVRDVMAVGRYLTRHPRVLALLGAKTGWGVAGALSMLLALFGEHIYPVAGSVDLGIAVLFMARGTGTAFGPIIARRLTRERESAVKIAIGMGFALGGVTYLAFAATSQQLLATVLVIIAHLGGSTVWVFSTVLLQRAVPDGFRGRVFAAELGLATAMITLSTWSYGWLLDRELLSPHEAAAAIGTSLLLATLAWAGAVFPGLRRSHPLE